MPATTDPAKATSKWLQRAQQSGNYYQDGTRGKGNEWAQNAAAAKDSYNMGVQAAIAQDRFAGGVQKAGASKYERGVTEKGVQRWAPGISASQQDYNKAISTVLSVINSVTLPPRGPRGSAQNYQRVQAIGEALRSAKEGGQI